jgi:hypothetical protein
MVTIVNHPERFELRWCCRICGRRCSLDTLWLAFPQGRAVEGEWVHRECTSGGRIESVFGTRRVTLMRGLEAIRQLATSLEDAADNPALARQQPRRPAKAKTS